MKGCVVLCEKFNDAICVDASTNTCCDDDKGDIPIDVFRVSSEVWYLVFFALY